MLLEPRCAHDIALGIMFERKSRVQVREIKSAKGPKDQIDAAVSYIRDILQASSMTL